MSQPSRILFVTGLSGAGRTTVLKTLEDIGWETVDNLPLGLLDRLLSSPPAEGAPDGQRPLAIGIDSRTRGFDAAAILRRIGRLREGAGDAETMFLDAADTVLTQRFSATRRRHPLALDRPAEDGIAQERALLKPLRDAADHLIDTSETTSDALQREIRRRFGDGDDAAAPTLVIASFSYKRGLPRDADLVLDMRFLRNPFWDPELRPFSGRDTKVSAYVAADPAYADATDQIERLLLTLLPRYREQGKSYVTVAFGCTGGRHRSVHVAELMGKRLRAAGFSPTIAHRDLAETQPDALGRTPDEGNGAVVTVGK
jgi:RNase adapter protein RapZ